MHMQDGCLCQLWLSLCSQETRFILMKWKIANNSQCNFCGQDEDYYLHYFISCPYLKEFWVKIQQILKKSNIENFVTLKHIVFGYKTK